jgi:hypothetical protein
MSDAVFPYHPKPPAAAVYPATNRGDPQRWLGYSLALGILAYYAPRTFYATTAGLIVYHVVRFSDIVHKPGSYERRYFSIQSWSVNACQVMFSISNVFTIYALCWFWSSLQAFRHLQVQQSVGHLASGCFFALAGLALMPFGNRGDALYKSKQWIDMEDYTSNYHHDIKREIASSRVLFFISALYREVVGDAIASVKIKTTVWFNQFAPVQTKCNGLIQYFIQCEKIPAPGDNPEWKEWVVAIHQSQRMLDTEGEPVQTKLMEHLTRIAKASSQQQVEALPSPVKERVLTSLTT